MDTLKVSSKSNPNSVAGPLTNVFRDKGKVFNCRGRFYGCY